MDGDYLRYFLERNDAIIIESFGVGGLPMGERYHFGEAIEWGINQGKTIVMTTQVPNEGSDMTLSGGTSFEAVRQCVGSL